MRALFDRASGGNRRLLVMLPAAKARPEDFFEHGFIAVLRERRLAFDVVAVDAHSDYYLEGDIIERLDAEVVRPMRAVGYSEIWLAGVSLGGMGAIAYACRHDAEIAGVMLIAPFLGVRGADRRPELLGTLARYRASERQLPAMFLGYGTRDRYAPASAMLAQWLPAERTTTIDGAHDWPTWIALWRIMLAQAFAT
jgi:pimeloyl-ACP methyl ester carboxylesterase